MTNGGATCSSAVMGQLCIWHVLVLAHISPLLVARGPVFVNSLVVSVSTSLQLLQAIALNNVTDVQMLNDISLKMNEWLSSPVVNISRSLTLRGMQKTLFSEALGSNYSEWTMLNINSVTQRLHMEPGVVVTFADLMLANHGTSSDGFYEPMFIASPGATVRHDHALGRRVVCSPYTTSQVNVHGVPRLTSVPGTQEAGILGRYCFGSAGSPEGFRLLPVCLDAHMNLRCFAGHVKQTSSNLGGGGGGGYDLVYDNRLYVCHHQVSPECLAQYGMASCLLRLEAQYLVNTPLGVTANGALVNSSVGAHATDSGCSGTSPQSTAGIIAGSVVGVALCLGLLTALYVWRRRSGAQGACRGADNKLVDKIGICLKAVVCGLDPHDGSHKATTHTSSGCDGAGTQPALQSAYAADAQSNMQSAAAATTPAAAPTGGDGFKQELEAMLRELTGASGTSELCMAEQIGRGAQGVVYRGTWRGQQVAVKCMIFDEGSEAEAGRMAQEVAIGLTLQHANVVSTLHYDLVCVAPRSTPSNPSSTRADTTTPQQAGSGGDMHAAVAGGLMGTAIHDPTLHKPRWKLYVVQEFCGEGDLGGAIRTRHLNAFLPFLQPQKNIADLLLLPGSGWGRNMPPSSGLYSRTHTGSPGSGSVQPPLPDPWVCYSILRGIAMGLQYIHSRGIIHGDLKPGNVLLKMSAARELQVKLCDFGLSIRLHADCTHVSDYKAGTPLYIAPEVIKASQVSPASDVYAYGIIMWEVCCGRRCFRPDPARAGAILPAKDFGRFPLNVDGAFKTLSHACLQVDPHARPPMSGILRALDGVHMRWMRKQHASSMQGAATSAHAPVAEDVCGARAPFFSAEMLAELQAAGTQDCMQSAVVVAAPAQGNAMLEQPASLHGHAHAGVMQVASPCHDTHAAEEHGTKVQPQPQPVQAGNEVAMLQALLKRLQG